MEALPEVIIIAGSNVSVYDIENGNIIACYKESKIAPKTLALVAEDYLLGALTTEPKIRVWTVSKWKNPETGVFPCSGIVNVLTVSSCGAYCIAGIKEEIHIWQVSSGELLNIITRHYQDVSCLRFSTDDSHLISGGKDGHVIVWVLSQVIAVHIERDQVKPRYVWNHHSSEVTDIFPGSLGCVSRVATTSLDMTCKIYELDSGILLSTVCVDVPLSSVVMDTMDYYVFLGANNGCIYKINTYESLPREFHFTDLKNIQFKAHEQKVISLSISLDGEKLMSASDDKSCRLWNIKSMACLINLSMEGGITNAFLAMKPTALPSDDVKPQFVIRPFKRQFDESGQQGIRKFTESKLISKPQTLVALDSSDQLYNDELLRCPAKVSKDGLNKPEKHYENMYQDSLHGGTVNELKAINNQLYSYVINHGFDNLPHDKSD